MKKMLLGLLVFASVMNANASTVRNVTLKPGVSNTLSDYFLAQFSAGANGFINQGGSGIEFGQIHCLPKLGSNPATCLVTETLNDKGNFQTDDSTSAMLFNFLLDQESAGNPEVVVTPGGLEYGQIICAPKVGQEQASCVID